MYSVVVDSGISCCDITVTVPEANVTESFFSLSRTFSFI